MVNVVMGDDNKANFLGSPSQAMDKTYYLWRAAVKSGIDKGQLFLNNQDYIAVPTCYLIDLRDDSHSTITPALDFDYLAVVVRANSAAVFTSVKSASV